MPKKFAVTPIEPLIMEFPDGSTRQAAFNVEAMICLQEEFGDLAELVNEEIARPYELAAKILYSGMKTFDTSVTLDEARAIIVGGGVLLMTEIMNLFGESFGEIDEEELKKNLIPAVNKMRESRPV
ncbi:MAG: hypothetical protein FWB96_12545 [Defluviitaleaceae bacterium]|nr:hypothetical protein [Defluviitaleaceae bacterium]MCL2263954.1 hypothetical protein [Defluviitaleaceae bacterium]